MCILELSKVLKYEFHYDYIKNKYDSKSKLSMNRIQSKDHRIGVNGINKISLSF